jgi:alkaline phosphatase D
MQSDGSPSRAAGSTGWELVDENGKEGTMNARVISVMVGLAALVGIGPCGVALAGAPPVASHGVASGDVTATSVVIWSRATAEGVMHVRVSGRAGESRTVYRSVPVVASEDFTGKVVIGGLRPDTEYEYRVWFESAPGQGRGAGDAGEERRRSRAAASGVFRTAPPADAPKPMLFAWGGDLAGQNVCRDAVEGFPIFDAINALPLDFFIGLGDMIYADGTCAAVGRYGNAQVPGDYTLATDLPSFWAHWKYNREDAGYRRLLARMPYYAIWDDHEVVNDFGPLHDTRTAPPYTPGVHLMPMGLAAFLDYNPIAERDETPNRLYRNVRWGRHVELFILDARQYRDANIAQDSAERPKTMLGREQLTWLKAKLAASDATWKILVSSVPLSIPTGFPPALGRDGWANFDQETGFEHELMDLLGFMRSREIRNVVSITTDVHFAEVFRYTPFADDPGFRLYEFVSGPLNAGLFPNRDHDATLGTESLFFYGPEGGDAGFTFAQAKPFMNFGTIHVDEAGRLTTAIRATDGHVVYEQTLTPQMPGIHPPGVGEPPVILP